MSTLTFIYSHNTAEWLESALKSLLDTSDEDLRIILADDCSTDQTPAVLVKYFPLLEEKFKLIKLENQSGQVLGFDKFSETVSNFLTTDVDRIVLMSQDKTVITPIEVNHTDV